MLQNPFLATTGGAVLVTYILTRWLFQMLNEFARSNFHPLQLPMVTCANLQTREEHQIEL